MEIQVQELLEKIKRDGIDPAKIEAERIVAEAGKQARDILDAARKDAESIVATAKVDAARLEESGKAALAQASRNLVLAFRSEIEAVLKSVIEREVKTAFGEKTLEDIIPSLLASWKEKGVEDLTVLLKSEDLAKLEGFFQKKLASELKAGLELKPFPGLKAGFRISEKSGASYWDFSGEAVSELLSQYLNPALAGIMKKSGGDR